MASKAEIKQELTGALESQISTKPKILWKNVTLAGILNQTIDLVTLKPNLTLKFGKFNFSPMDLGEFLHNKGVNEEEINAQEKLVESLSWGTPIIRDCESLSVLALAQAGYSCGLHPADFESTVDSVGGEITLQMLTVEV